MSSLHLVKSVLMVCSALLVLAGAGQSQNGSASRTSKSPDPLRAFLQDYLQDDLDGDAQVNKQGLRYLAAFTDLNNDGKKEAIVYLQTPHFCGTNGCPLMVLAPEGSSYRVVSEIPLTRLPIRILSTASHGWRDLAVGAEGHESGLQFDGNTYANARGKIDDKIPAEVLIPAPETIKKSAVR